VLAALLLTACSDSEPGADDTHDIDDVAGVAWSPCDGLTADRVSEIAGEPMLVQTGTSDQPRCTFTPETEGGTAYDVNYLLFDGGLEDALAAMGAGSARLRPVDVPGADAARIAVRERESGILVSGFVQTAGLVQSVNAVHLSPYDRGALVASTTDLLAELVTQAP
jgi:hypothetical protein